MVHSVVAALFVVTMLAHIKWNHRHGGCVRGVGRSVDVNLGKWGPTVDVNWASDHHNLWLEQKTRKGDAVVDARAAVAVAE